MHCYTDATDPVEEITLEDVIVFFSGSDKIPPLGFPRSPTLNFSQDNLYPTASTCALVLTLPTQYGRQYDSFKDAMTVGFKFHGGFGNI